MPGFVHGRFLLIFNPWIGVFYYLQAINLLHFGSANTALDTPSSGDHMQDTVLFLQHHWTLSVTFLVGLIILVCVEFFNQKRSPASLSPIQATYMLNRENAKIVDIRSAAHYSDGHIIGAVSLPLSELKEKINKLQKFKSQPIVITCASGVESLRASTLLKAEGYDVRILAGGVRAWSDANMPLVKD
jgi:rhodanese-related sulfurtransferase